MEVLSPWEIRNEWRGCEKALKNYFGCLLGGEGHFEKMEPISFFNELKIHFFRREVLV